MPVWVRRAVGPAFSVSAMVFFGVTHPPGTYPLHVVATWASPTHFSFLDSQPELMQYCTLRGTMIGSFTFLVRLEKQVKILASASF